MASLPDSRNDFHSPFNFSSPSLSRDFIFDNTGKKNFLYGIFASVNTPSVRLEHSKVIFGIASLWLFIYGLFRIRSAFKSNSSIINSTHESSSLLTTISIVSILTFANPHVYLDTMILIGSISQQFQGLNRAYFAFGACSGSFVWFFGIAFGAKLLTPLMQKPRHWRILDSLIAIIMFIIAINLASQGGWI